MAKKLSTEECYALLEVFNGKKHTFDTLPKEKLKNHDMIPAGTKKNPTLPELVPIFQFIYENFCRSIQKKFSHEFKINIYFKMLSIDIIRFGEYKKSLEVNSLTFIFNTKEIHSSVLIHIKDNFGASLVNKSLGSSKNYQISGEYAHSKIDEAIILKQVFLISKELEMSINSAYEKINLNYVRSENRPQLLSVFHPNDEMLLSVIEISSNSINGIFHMVLPGIGLKLLQSKKL